MAKQQPPISLGVQTTGLTQLTKAVRAADKTLAANLRTRLRAVGNTVRDRARGNASWSTRIPASIKTSVTTKGVSIKAGGKNAPHAAALEHGGQSGTFRHPVFSSDVWVDQAARPFLIPALNVDEAQNAALAALDDWIRDCGFA